jgi:hypothetical protein
MVAFLTLTCAQTWNQTFLPTNYIISRPSSHWTFLLHTTAFDYQINPQLPP